MIVIKILALIIAILVFLILCILCIPFGYKLKGKRLDETYARANVFWLFGLLGFEAVFTPDEGLKFKLILFGLRLRIPDFKKKVDEKEKEPKEKKAKAGGKKKFSLSNFSIEALQYMTSHAQKMLIHLLPDRIDGYGRIGFYDPYYTGMVGAVIEMLKQNHFHTPNLEYVFDEEIYEGELYIKGRIFLAYLGYIALRLLLHKSIRKLLFN